MLQALIDRRTTFLENEFALLRTECANSVHASRRLLLKTQGTLMLVYSGRYSDSIHRGNKKGASVDGAGSGGHS